MDDRRIFQSGQTEWELHLTVHFCESSFVKQFFAHALFLVGAWSFVCDSVEHIGAIIRRVAEEQDHFLEETAPTWTCSKYFTSADQRVNY